MHHALAHPYCLTLQRNPFGGRLVEKFISMKNPLFFLAPIFSILLGASCGECLQDDICNEGATLKFEYLSQTDSSNLIKTGQFEVSDVRWQYLLKDAGGPRPDTLFFNDGGNTIYLWVIPNTNLKGVVAQLSTFKPDTILVDIGEEKTRCCGTTTVLNSATLNGRPLSLVGLFAIPLYK